MPGDVPKFWPIRDREIISHSQTDTLTQNQHTVRPCSTSSTCKNGNISIFAPDWFWFLIILPCCSDFALNFLPFSGCSYSNCTLVTTLEQNSLKAAVADKIYFQVLFCYNSHPSVSPLTLSPPVRVVSWHSDGGILDSAGRGIKR